MMKNRECFIVAAIDVCSSSSGYAFIFMHDFIKYPLNIQISHIWEDEFPHDWSSKASSCVLLNPKREFLAFGYKAEDLYSDLVFKGNHSDYYFFKDFKMVLRETQVSTLTEIKDILSVMKSC